MIDLPTLAFTTPWTLIALPVLPLLWWLLRITPPAPRQIAFPAIRLLHGLVPVDHTPAHTPLWLLLLRLLIVVLVILGLARPLLNPDAALPGQGPLLLVIDNGWAAARDWPARQRVLAAWLERAERQQRLVRWLATAPAADGRPPHLSPPLRVIEARTALASLLPQPWPVDHAAALAAVRAVQLEGTALSVWLSDGLQSGHATSALLEGLRRLGALELVREPPSRLPAVIQAAEHQAAALVVRLVRGGVAEPLLRTVRLSAGDGRVLGRQPVSFAPGVMQAEARFELPAAVRNSVTRLALEEESTAAAVLLLDDRWQRRTVGIISGRGAEGDQPLLDSLHYLERALLPFADLRRGDAADLLKGAPAVLILADYSLTDDESTHRLENWIRRGGVLVRFAGPRLAQKPDTLVPVRLRPGERRLGGTLSWSEPSHLAPFPPHGPFIGLEVPEEVTVTRQVLAEPAVDSTDRTWARLSDGTPLVTGERRGEGWLVLIHTTANPDWSNLSLSGLFVDMLRRLVDLSVGSGVEAGTGEHAEAGVLAAISVLNGFGQPGTPGLAVRPLAAGRLSATQPGPEHPPGLYGPENGRRALNLGPWLTGMAPVPPSPVGLPVRDYALHGAERDLGPWLLAAALLLTALDFTLALLLRGLFTRVPGGPPRHPTPHAATRWLMLVPLIGVGSLAGLLAAAEPAGAFSERQMARFAAETWLAYVYSGDARVDEIAQAGLEGLATALSQRTAADIAGVVGVDVHTDELALFPLLYWPVLPQAAPLPERTRHRLNAYLRHGGTLFFDTRDQPYGGSQGGEGSRALRDLVDGLDIPPLMPVPADHVLGKAFYLLNDFPGRYSGGTVWVEAREERERDGVSAVLVGAHDWAGAWAIDRQGRPRLAVTPGGERQRELALRFGINVIMYALTGNYKADQVHVPAILDRLGP